ncbi:hypothetical protein STEG23_026390 [Scotinomys teguina]
MPNRQPRLLPDSPCRSPERNVYNSGLKFVLRKKAKAWLSSKERPWKSHRYSHFLENWFWESQWSAWKNNLIWKKAALELGTQEGSQSISIPQKSLSVSRNINIPIQKQQHPQTFRLVLTFSGISGLHYFRTCHYNIKL